MNFFLCPILIASIYEHFNIISCNFLFQDKPVPFLFFVNDTPIKDNFINYVDSNKIGFEKVTEISYAEQSVFRVRPVTRCTSSLPGHAEAVISASFSPDGR